MSEVALSQKKRPLHFPAKENLIKLDFKGRSRNLKMNGL